LAVGWFCLPGLLLLAVDSHVVNIHTSPFTFLWVLLSYWTSHVWLAVRAFMLFRRRTRELRDILQVVVIAGTVVFIDILLALDGQ
jgi:hypothetical protein